MCHLHARTQPRRSKAYNRFCAEKRTRPIPAILLLDPTQRKVAKTTPHHVVFDASDDELQGVLTKVMTPQEAATRPLHRIPRPATSVKEGRMTTEARLLERRREEKNH